MKPLIQANKRQSHHRHLAILTAGFVSIADLCRAVETRLTDPVSRELIYKVISGERQKGPDAQRIKAVIAKMLKRSESYLWPNDNRDK